jgi:hypothetical protein
VAKRADVLSFEVAEPLSEPNLVFRFTCGAVCNRKVMRVLGRLASASLDDVRGSGDDGAWNARSFLGSLMPTACNT